MAFAFAGSILLSDFVLGSPAGFPSGSYENNGTFAIFQGLETFQSAQSSCNNVLANLASAGSPDDWSTITQLLQSFWYGNSSAATMYAADPPYTSPYVGMNNSGFAVNNNYLQVRMHACTMLPSSPSNLMHTNASLDHADEPSPHNEHEPVTKATKPHTTWSGPVIGTCFYGPSLSA